MPITANHLILNTLQNLSRAVGRASARDPSKDFTRVIPNPSKAYAFGGLGVATAGKDAPAPVRFGAVTKNLDPVGEMLGTSSDVHKAVGWTYDNPGIRFSDRTKGSARPLSADGAQSFHFRHSYYSKASPIRELIEAARGGRRHTNSNATDHLLYIERDGAAEKVGKEKEYPGYDPDVEFDGLERDAAGRSAESQQEFLERLGTVTRTFVHDLSDDELDKLEYASFGNIGETIEERRHFWNALEKVEQDPQDKVKIEFADCPELWALAVQNLKLAPAPLRKALEAQAAAVEPADFKKKLSTKAALDIYNWIAGLDPKAPIEIIPGRGGRIQNRIIAELPFELDGRERVEIVRNFTKKLTEKGLPFWAVIHAPDANNDGRNYHVHIVYADRPAARMKDPKNPDGPEVWDFEIQEVKTYKSRNRRVAHPYVQNKLPEVSTSKTEAVKWVPILREHWAKVSNEVMDRVGLVKRYDHRSYEAMGIQVDPQKHIPSKSFNKERKGELTAEGVGLARRQWQVVQDRLVADHRKRAQHRHLKLKEKTDKARAVLGSQSPYRDIALKEVDRLTQIIERLGNRISTSELFQDLTRLVVDRVASRPKLIIDADRKKNEKSLVRTKAKDAQGHGQTTQAPKDKNSATPPVGSVARETMTFLLEVFGHAILMDRRTWAEIKVARSQLNVLLKRLDHMIADPKRHPLDRRSPGFVDLNVVDPGPEVMAARKRERMERITSRLNAYVEAAVPKILAEVTGRSASNPEPNKEKFPQVSAPDQPSSTRTEPVARNPIRVNSEEARAQIDRSVSDRASQQGPAGTQAAPARTAHAEPVQKPVSARPEEKVARPQKTRFRPEPFYKPKEKAETPAAAPTKNPAAGPVKSAAPTPASSAAKASAPNSLRTEAVSKPVVAENSRQPSKPALNNVPKPENAAPGTKPARDNSGPGVSKPATAAPSAPAQAQRPAAAPANTKPAQTQAPSRPAQSTAPQAGSTKEQATAKVTSALAPVPAQTNSSSQAPAQIPVPRPEPARTAPGPVTGIGKSNVAKAASEAKAPAQPERAPVAPKPSPAPFDPARIPGESSGENPAAKPAKEEAWIRVGEPISLGAFQPTEPIRVEGKKQLKKPKRRGRGRDEGPEL